MSDNSENNGELEKLDLTTPNFTDQNIMHIAELFPNVVTESRDEDGKVKHAIDFDALKQELSDNIVEGPQERYQLNWPGKRKAMLTASTPINKTLRPCREESVDFDTTKNLFIEGDNLDALKLLQETYLGKVKMIYIDPPYNTGFDFIYKDNFTASAKNFLLKSNQQDVDGNRFVANIESNGRFHSDWLSMIYPRLKIAKYLLSDAGVICISIDDNEQSSMRLLCDEIFGSENFVGQLVWKRRVPSAMANNTISTDHEYVLCYGKLKFGGFKGEPKDFSNYSNPDDDPRGPWISDNLTVGMNASMRPNQAYDLIDPATGRSFPFNPNRVWAYIPSSMSKMIAEGRILFPEDLSRRPMLKRFKSELKSNSNPFSTLMLDKVGMNTEATREIQSLFGVNVFEYTKPISLLTTLIEQITTEDDVVLDFFAGSGVSAQAAMQVNAKDGFRRKFILAQLPESLSEKSVGAQQGFKNIADISKERIRRAGKKILEENPDQVGKLDVGFRVLKIESSNMTDVWHSPEQISQDDLLSQVSNIKPDRTAEDLLFQVLLDWGVDLTLPIARESTEGKDVFFVDDNALAACFDAGVSEELVKQIAQRKPLRVVFRDDGFDSDATKINVEQLFKHLSPHTEVKVI